MLGHLHETHFGFSEDEELIDRALSELIAAYERKDGPALCRAFDAIVSLIQSKEESASADAHETT